MVQFVHRIMTMWLHYGSGYIMQVTTCTVYISSSGCIMSLWVCPEWAICRPCNTSWPLNISYSLQKLEEKCSSQKSRYQGLHHFYFHLLEHLSGPWIPLLGLRLPTAVHQVFRPSSPILVRPSHHLQHPVLLLLHLLLHSVLVWPSCHVQHQVLEKRLVNQGFQHYTQAQPDLDGKKN